MSELIGRIGFLQEGPFAVARWQALFGNMEQLWQGLLVTLQVASLGLALALALGVVFGVMSSSTWRLPCAIARVYVEFFQNTPLLVQVFMIFNVIPMLSKGMFIPVMVIGVIGVGMYHGAYISEVVRAGIQSIGSGQLEAGLSQGFSYVGTMRHIIIPQAMRIVLPPLTNQAVNLIKNTSVLAVIAGGDLMYAGDSFAGRHGHYGPTYIVVGMLYFFMCFPLAVLTRRLEERLRAGE
ncbi:MAG: amino acid ABC transporter permease [Coriobacteriia bacterium]|nr:amino acid ABC transporter permease [Coriobacteriia bacterium]